MPWLERNVVHIRVVVVFVAVAENGSLPASCTMKASYASYASYSTAALTAAALTALSPRSHRAPHRAPHRALHRTFLGNGDLLTRRLPYFQYGTVLYSPSTVIPGPLYTKQHPKAATPSIVHRPSPSPGLCMHAPQPAHHTPATTPTAPKTHQKAASTHTYRTVRTHHDHMPPTPAAILNPKPATTRLVIASPPLTSTTTPGAIPE